MEDDDILREFLIESADNLARLDQEMVELEKDPDRQELLASIFRTIHTIKGTCGFLGFGRLEGIAHITEDILNELRHNRRRLDGPLTSVILQSVDAIKRILRSIETTSGEGEPFEEEILATLKQRGPAPPEPAELAISAPATAGAPPTVAQTANVKGEPPAGAPGAVSNLAESALRVDVGLLDRLMNLVGELVLTRNQVL